MDLKQSIGAFLQMALIYFMNSVHFTDESHIDTILHYPNPERVSIFIDALMYLKSFDEVKYMLYDVCIEPELKFIVHYTLYG